MVAWFLPAVLIVGFLAIGGPAAADAIGDLNACYDANDRQDYDTAIMLCGRAVQSGKLSDGDAALALNDQGNAYNAKGDYDRAIASYDQAIKLQPDYPDPYFNRATAFEGQGAYDRAVADYGQSIKFWPDDAVAYFNRGSDRNLIGQYAEALYDLDQAMQLDPAYAGVASWSKGQALFGLGRYAEASDMIERYLLEKPSYSYGMLWLYLAEAGAGRDPKPKLAARARAIDLAEWPGPIIARYLGTDTAEDVRAAAGRGDPGYLEDQACEAAFYLGAFERTSGKTEDARRDLMEAATTCPKYAAERGAAQAALDRM